MKRFFLALAVLLAGDFLPHHIADNNGYVTEVPIWVDMVEGRDGIWEYTTDCPLAPELYSYMFRIDDLPYAAPAKATIPEAFPDLMKYVESHYRVLKGADNTAMCGLSMGGGHTLQTTAMYPGKFGYIGIFSGAIFSGDTDNLATVFAKNPKVYFVACGKADPIARFSFEFVEHLEQKGYPHQSLWTDGAHTWKNWRNYLMIFAEQLFK